MFLTQILLFSVTLVSSAAVSRDSGINPIFMDLKQVDTDAKSQSSRVNNWDGSLSSATAISNGEDTLDKDIKNAIADANNSAVQSTSDGQNIVNYIQNTLEPDLAAVCSAYINRKAQFQKAGLLNTYKSWVQNFKSEVDQYFAALGSKLPSSTQQSSLKASQAKFDNACNPNSIGVPN